MVSSLKKKKLLKKSYTDYRDADVEQSNMVQRDIKQYKFYINEKCFEKPDNYKPNTSSNLKVYGIKKIDTDNYNFYPEAKSYNVFENFSTSEFFIKLTGWHAMYLDGSIVNPLVYTPVYNNNNFKIQCAIGHARLLFKYAVGDMVPFSENLEYPAYYYDYGDTNLDELENILGKENLVEVRNIIPEYIESRTKRKPARISAPFQSPSWIDNYRGQHKKFWQYIEEHKYELHFYRNGELQFHMKLGKPPLRINLDHEGVLSWVGLCQATLWFFFGIDNWSNGKKYFSVG